MLPIWLSRQSTFRICTKCTRPIHIRRMINIQLWTTFKWAEILKERHLTSHNLAQLDLARLHPKTSHSSLTMVCSRCNSNSSILNSNSSSPNTNSNSRINLILLVASNSSSSMPSRLPTNLHSVDSSKLNNQHLAGVKINPLLTVDLISSHSNNKVLEISSRRSQRNKYLKMDWSIWITSVEPISNLRMASTLSATNHLNPNNNTTPSVPLAPPKDSNSSSLSKKMAKTHSKGWLISEYLNIWFVDN